MLRLCGQRVEVLIRGMGSLLTSYDAIVQCGGGFNKPMVKDAEHPTIKGVLGASSPNAYFIHGSHEAMLERIFIEPLVKLCLRHRQIRQHHDDDEA